MVVSPYLRFVPAWNRPPSCDQHNQVPAKRVALLASVRRLEGWVGVILSAKVKGVDDCIFVGISQF